MLPHRLLLILLSLVSLVLAGCGDSEDYVFTQSPQPASGQAATVQLRSVLEQTVVPSTVASFRATGFDSAGAIRFGPETVAKAALVVWDDVPVEVTEFLVEYVNAQGSLLGVSRTRVTLVSGGTFVIESPTIVPVTATLDRITLSPSTRTIAKGTSAEFTATGVFSDGSTRNLTATATWTSSSATVATVSQGEATGLEVGTTTLTATFGNVSGTATLTVSEATLVSLNLSPNSASIARGTAQAFTVEGFFSDGTFQDLTADADWSSSNTTVSTVVDGLASGSEVGATIVTASMAGVSDQAELTVTAATLQSLTVSGPTSIAKGTSADFTATGTFSDNTTQDLTATADWSVDPVDAATIDAGHLLGLLNGTVTVTADVDGVSDDAELEITEAVITSIAVSTVGDVAPQIYVNGTLSLVATATYSDNTTQDVTADAEWWADDQVATVDAGLVTGIGTGQTNVIATLGLQSGWIEVDVEDPTELTLESGQTYAFNTTSGKLVGPGLPAGPLPNWDSVAHRLRLTSFVMGSGAVLNVTGDVAFGILGEDLTIDGAIDFSGRDGARGLDGRIATDGGDGTNGGDIELYATGSLSGSGALLSNGGRGGDGGGFFLEGENRENITAGRGGDGGQAGEVTISINGSPGALDVSLGGGAGGAGGDVEITATNYSNTTVTAGAGGDGGNGQPGGHGGEVTIRDRTNVGSAYGLSAVVAGKGGNGGDNAPGGDGGGVSMWGNHVSGQYAQAFATGGAGGNGGRNAPGGDGGEVTMQEGCILSGNDSQVSTTGGAGGNGGENARGGDGGEVTLRTFNLVSGDRSESFVTGGAGGDGGDDAPGGDGGGVVIAQDNTVPGDDSSLVVTGGAGGDGWGGGDGGAVQVLGYQVQQGANASAATRGGRGGDGFAGTTGGSGGAATRGIVAQGVLEAGDDGDSLP